MKDTEHRSSGSLLLLVLRGINIGHCGDTINSPPPMHTGHRSRNDLHSFNARCRKNACERGGVDVKEPTSTHDPLHTFAGVDQICKLQGKEGSEDTEITSTPCIPSRFQMEHRRRATRWSASHGCFVDRVNLYSDLAGPSPDSLPSRAGRTRSHTERRERESSARVYMYGKHNRTVGKLGASKR